MNRHMRLAVLTPLVASSLALGSAGLLAGSAQAAAPSMTCSVAESKVDPQHEFQVLVKDAKPGVNVDITTPSSKSSGKANAAGEVSISFGPKAGNVTATQEGTTISCGTVKEAEQHDARAQYAAGFKKGLADTRADCKKEPPAQGVAPLDPNYERGYNAGALAALDRFCKD